MICPSCDHTIDNNAMVCPDCGVYVLLAKKNEQNCPYCNEKVKIGAEFCKHCTRDLTLDKKAWYQKKTVMIPIIILEVFLIWIILMTISDFTNTIQEFQYRNNRLEVMGKLAETLDDMNNIDSITEYTFGSDKKIYIELFAYTYDSKTIENDVYSILTKLAPSLLKEMIRISEITVVVNTPTKGKFTSINSIGDIGKINTGFWQKEEWLKESEFIRKDLF